MLKSNKPVAVAFWATWCGPCKRFAPILDEIAGENANKITVARVDVDANPSTAGRYQIRAVPTTMVSQDGKEATRVMGARPKSALLDDLADYLG